MSDLPTTIDSSYVDRNPADKLHQQHHDSVHALHNELKGTTGVSAALRAKLDDYFLLLAGGTLTGALVLAGDPAVALGAATKQYVDATTTVRVYRATTNQAIANITTTLVQWNAETRDAAGFHDNVTNNARLTVPAGKAGLYRVVAVVQFATNSTGIRDLYILVNGVNKAVMTRSIVGAQIETLVLTTQLDLAVADYVEAAVWHNAGVSVDVNAGEQTSFLELEKI